MTDNAGGGDRSHGNTWLNPRMATVLRSTRWSIEVAVIRMLIGDHPLRGSPFNLCFFFNETFFYLGKTCGVCHV